MAQISLRSWETLHLLIMVIQVLATYHGQSRPECNAHFIVDVSRNALDTTTASQAAKDLVNKAQNP